MPNPKELPIKKRYQQGFGVIYLVVAIVLASTVFDNYNSFVVGAIMLVIYLIFHYIIGIYAEKKV